MKNLSNKSPLSARRIAYLALFTAIALVLSLIENALPPVMLFAPGAKLGLGNVASLAALIVLGIPDAIIVTLLKVLMTTLLGGNVFALMYSAPASVAALIVQIFLYKAVFNKVGIPMISIAGAVIFNITQLLVAGLITQANLIALLPLMLSASVIAGLFTGLCVHLTLKKLPYSVLGEI